MTIKPVIAAILASLLTGCEKEADRLKIDTYTLEETQVANITNKASAEISIESVTVNDGSCSARFAYKIHFPVPADHIPLKLGSGDSIQLVMPCKLSSLQVNTDKGSFTYTWN